MREKMDQTDFKTSLSDKKQERGRERWGEKRMRELNETMADGGRNSHFLN